ncbi:MAG: hypothetical protein KAF91_27815 [Nostoc sp. TH1S01]|nr:hypothetical protein [Nostoc sp. TH1S01]
MLTISIEQKQQIKEIIRRYKNLECVECAQRLFEKWLVVIISTY